MVKPANDTKLQNRIRALTKDGYLSHADFAKIEKGIKKDKKVTASERQTLDREIGRFVDKFDDSNSKLNSHFGKVARKDYNDFRVSQPDAYLQSLPSTDLDTGNRLGKGEQFGERFPVKDGAQMVDGGTGHSRGTLLAPKGVWINFGQKKLIHGKECVYVFNARVRGPDGKAFATSGWVPLSNFPKGTKPHTMGDVRAPTAPIDHTLPRYDIVGAEDTYPEGVHVVPPKEGEGNQAPGDYLTRPGGVVHLLYTLPGHGGVANDTLRINQKGVHFERSTVPAEDIPLYNADGTLTGEKQRYVYGCVVDNEGHRRFGWIAEANLKARA